MLEIRNFSKSYTSQKKAVDNISLVIENGDIFGFIGKNGAGKTTTIKAIVGIHSIDDGDIIYNGISLKNDKLNCQKEMAYLPDNPNLYEFMTGEKYINFVADMYNTPLDERKPFLEKYAKELEIYDNLSQPISSYSHGMKQKVALLSALIHKPRLLILDEPFVGLDPKSSFTLKNYMKELTKSGVSIFFSSHGLEVVQTLCNKIAIIQNGKIVEKGLTETLLGNKSLENYFLELTENE